MKKLALIALLAVSGLANAAYVGIDAGPVRRDLIVQDPVNEGIATYPAMNAEPMVTPADQGYYYTPYGERSGATYNGYNYNGPVSNTLSGASNIANEAVQDVASVIPF